MGAHMHSCSRVYAATQVNKNTLTICPRQGTNSQYGPNIIP